MLTSGMHYLPTPFQGMPFSSASHALIKLGCMHNPSGISSGQCWCAFTWQHTWARTAILLQLSWTPALAQSYSLAASAAARQPGGSRQPGAHWGQPQSPEVSCLTWQHGLWAVLVGAAAWWMVWAGSALQGGEGGAGREGRRQATCSSRTLHVFVQQVAAAQPAP